MNVFVRMEEASVSFYGKKVLRNVSVDFWRSGISIVAGRSGSGKTTLLRTINRLNEEFPGCATEGRIEANIGEGLETVFPVLPKKYSLPMLRRRVGMLFQTPTIFPASVYANISAPLKRITSCPQSELADRVRLALESVGLFKEVADRLHVPAKFLSGGQRQRLCLARALALEPKILLLDEPTASLDAQASRKIESLLLRLSEEFPIIMVSHNAAQIARLARHLIVVEEGRVKRKEYDNFFSEEELTTFFEGDLA